ncbi:ABC-type cobalt transport system, permease component [Secundilactobacillus oryzae JCM 18671]|uniref:ABC-type cobalt transport system, permease component n=1 Tax=Secundilactobacillus oryzae JCM 18671 TaxID=1291743 RepID=A0A081BJV9_9LACO|nr:energy-coupling factor transporter transmembrane component T [Secundilactobacillus oryzae]GAK48327.1 ABC-type cobalt transport system, permease component [Secundilactobacillus oryzae JCM 18671]
MNTDDFIVTYSAGSRGLERLNGASKVVLLLSSILLIVVSFDIRILLATSIINLGLVISLKPRWRKIKGITIFVVVMNLINVLLMYLVAPNIGAQGIGSSTVWFQFNSFYIVTPETLFYLFIRLLKIFDMFLASLWFVLSTTPSQLAAGLYHLGVPYKVCTIVSLGLRSIPDILRNYRQVNEAMQMRGVELDAKKASITKRLKQSLTVLIPLILTSFERVDVIANAMDLRLYGIGKHRTYYAEEKPNRFDLAIRLFALLQFVGLVVYLFIAIKTNTFGASHAWYPF